MAPKTVFTNTNNIPEVYHANGWQNHVHDAVDDNGHSSKIVLTGAAHVTGVLPLANVNGLIDILNSIDGEVGDLKPSNRLTSNTDGRWVPCDGTVLNVPDPNIQGNEAYADYVTLMGNRNIPNLTGCTLVGYGSYVNPSTGFSKTFTKQLTVGDVAHKLILGELPATTMYSRETGSMNWNPGGGNESYINKVSYSGTSDKEHNNVQPSFGIVWFIKVKKISI